jgi:hypothetical protein
MSSRFMDDIDEEGLRAEDEDEDESTCEAAN